MRALLLVVCLFPAIASAVDFKIHLGCYHLTERDYLKKGDSLNEQNPGLGIVIEDYEVGFYKNSMSRESVYLYRSIPLTQNISTFAGVVSGYNETILPATGLVFSYEHSQVTLIPGFTDKGTIVPVLSYSVKF